MKIYSLILALFVLIGLSACGESGGGMEEAGEAMGEMVDEAGEALEDAGGRLADSGPAGRFEETAWDRSNEDGSPGTSSRSPAC